MAIAYERFWLVKAHDGVRERTLQCPLCGHDKFSQDTISIWVETGEYSSRLYRYMCENCDNVILNRGPLCTRKGNLGSSE